MTAFKNGRAALAVTAGLVGALSLGSAAIAAAPVSAYAEASVKSGVNLASAEIVKAYDGYMGQEVSDYEDFDLGKYLFPTEIRVDGNKTYTVIDDSTWVPNEGFSFQYKKLNDDGKYVDVDSIQEASKTAGHYRLVVKYEGEEKSFDFTVGDPDALSAGEVAFYVDGQLEQTTAEDPYLVAYDGEDFLDQLTAKVKGKDGKYVDSSKLEFSVEKDGKDYDSVVDADEDNDYVVKVTAEGETFEEDANTFYVKVMKQEVDPNDYTVADKNGVKSPTVAWTGSAVELPAVKYDAQWYKGGSGAQTGLKEYDGEQVVRTLPAGAYEVYQVVDADSGKVYDADAVVDEGNYTASIKLTKEGAKNYKLKYKDMKFSVAKRDGFTDVDPASWYADAVNKANAQGFMTGLAGTATFDPYGSLTRGQAVQVLFNMAGNDRVYDEFGSDTDKSYASYADVDAGAWYAKAVAWAKAYGVVSGYPDGTFKAEQAVSRQEFAKMLQNYAAKTAQGTDAKADLSAYTDANTLGWGRDAVAWAVANKAMGQGTTVLKPADNISRAEVAAMTTRFQAKQLTSKVVK